MWDDRELLYNEIQMQKYLLSLIDQQLADKPFEPKLLKDFREKKELINKLEKKLSELDN